MKHSLVYIAACIIIGSLLTWLSLAIQSDFLIGFLRANLLLLLPALTAINVTTLGVVMTKLRELSEKYGVKFEGTIKEMRASFLEQTLLMIVSAMFLIADGARNITWLPVLHHHYIRIIVQSLICACFVYALSILHDTAKSIFIILAFENKPSADD